MTTTTKYRRGLLAAVLAAAVLLLSGCLKLDMQLTIRADDTVDGTIIMAFADEIAELAGTDPESLWEQEGEDLESDLPPGATQEPYSEDGYTGTKVTFQDVPLSELTGGGTEGLMITRDGEEFVLEWDMDMAEGGEELDDLSSSIFGSFDIRVSVTFPGPVRDHNGTLQGRTVTWEPTAGETTTMRARASAESSGIGGVLDGGSFPWLLIFGVVFVVGLAVVTAILLVGRSRRAKPAAETAQTTAYPPPAGPTAYPQQPTGYPQTPPAAPQQPTAYPQAGGPQDPAQPGEEPGGEPPSAPRPPG